MLTIVLFLLVGAFLGYLIWQHNASAATALMSVQAAQGEVVKAQKEVIEALKENRETTEAMIYVLSLPQGERERLNLMRPRALSGMQR